MKPKDWISVAILVLTIIGKLCPQLLEHESNGENEDMVLDTEKPESTLVE